MDNRMEYIAARSISGLPTESIGEYTLPDYNGDVKKILYTDARVIPSRGFISGDLIEYSGVVLYSVIYLDSEDKLSHAELTSDYEGTVKAAEGIRDFDIDTVLTGYSVRPVGPRKLAARSTLSSTAYVTRDSELVSGECDGYEPEAKMGKIKLATVHMDKSGEREYAEELCHLDGVILDDVDVLYTDCKTEKCELTLGEEGVIYRGELAVCALIKEGDGAPFSLEKKIPFEERFFDGAAPYLDMTDVYATPNLTVSSIKCTPSADEDGVGIVVSLITEGKVRVVGNRELEVMLDGYLVGCECERKYEELDYTESGALKEALIKVGDTLARDVIGLEGTRNILLPSAEVKIHEVNTDEGLEITGETRFSGIACKIKEDGAPEYTQIKINVPFKEKVNNSSQFCDKSHLEYKAELVNVAIGLNNESVNPSADVLLRIMPSCDKKVRYITSLEPGGEEEIKDESVVTVYYPEDGETLFDIAKKYKVQAIRIASVNAITESVFARSDEPVRALGIEKVVIR